MAMQEYVTRGADRDEHALAIVMGEARVTYGGLEELSNKVAWTLKEAGCRPGDRVALLMGKSPDTLAAMVGVLKADCLYVPIDVANPAVRAERIIRVAEPRAALIDRSAGRLVEALDDLNVVQDLVLGSVDGAVGDDAATRLAFTRSDVDGAGATRPAWCRSGDDPAHLLFTSGSTGMPKGVAITHRNVTAFVQWALDHFGMAPTDRNSGHAPLHFDLSTFDVYGSFAAAACLYPVPPAYNLLPQKIAAFIRESELTQWFSVPSLLTHLVKHDAVRMDDFPALERLLWCGEAMPTPTLIALMERLPHVTFTNLYGPTEATIASSYYTVPGVPGDPTEPIPIGEPCSGEALWILDEQLASVDEEVGELFISGVGLSPGYWGDEERTRQAFVPHPFDASPGARIYRTGDLGRRGADGLFYCLGRTDSQIKSRGYRIELGEVEAALHAIARLAEGAIVAVDSEGFEGSIICCAYVAKDGIMTQELRTELTLRLPSYMLPVRWLELESLPKNANGKVDRPEIRRRFQELAS